jgi:hypothetical protein
MDYPDYTYVFDDITDLPSRVQVIKHHRRSAHLVRVGVDDDQVLLKSLRQMPAPVADFVDLAVVVYVADWLSIRRADLARSIHVVLPVRHPEVLVSSEIIRHLHDILYWFTGDNWSFEFTRRTKDGRRAELQRCWPMNADRGPPDEVALWSGGLDSFAGLCGRLLAAPTKRVTLFGTGSNTIIYNTQQQVAQDVASTFPGQTTLVQVPIRLNETRELPKNSSQRSRGFVFMLLGAACAFMEGRDRLYIYENGIGAINLPYRASEVGLDHARSVHLLSLLRMSELISQLLGISFTFRNPFQFQTKAQLCSALMEASVTDLAFRTITCDRLHREQPMQCGCCSSCLLRRQALAVQRIVDQTPYLMIGTQSEDRLRRRAKGVHLLAVLRQVDILCTKLGTLDPWRSMAKEYPVLFDIVDWTAKEQGIVPSSIADRLLQMYRNYVDEWDAVRHIIKQGLLEDEGMRKAA